MAAMFSGEGGGGLPRDPRLGEPDLWCTQLQVLVSGQARMEAKLEEVVAAQQRAAGAKDIQSTLQEQDSQGSRSHSANEDAYADLLSRMLATQERLLEEGKAMFQGVAMAPVPLPVQVPLGAAPASWQHATVASQSTTRAQNGIEPDLGDTDTALQIASPQWQSATNAQPEGGNETSHMNRASTVNSTGTALSAFSRARAKSRAMGPPGKKKRGAKEDAAHRQVHAILHAWVPQPLQWWWSEQMQQKSTGLLAHIVVSKWFDRVCLIVICLDVYLSIWGADFSAKYKTLSLPASSQYLEGACMIFYMLELVLKLIVYRLRFFCGQDAAWNWLDIIVVSAAIFERFLEEGLDVTPLRMSRLLKAGRTLRTMRAFRFLASFRLMIMSVVGSMIPFMWTVLLLLFILMQFALLFMYGLLGHELGGDEVTDDFSEWVTRDFGSVPRSMVVLFQAVTGGTDWGPIYDSLRASGSFYSLVFVLYVIFFFISFMNISTSMFVEKAMQLSKPEPAEQMVDKRRAEREAARQLQKLIDAMDLDHSGFITLEEWREMCENEDFLDFFDYWTLDITDADAFFQALVGMTGESDLAIESFVDGCMQMKGEATSIDVQILLTEVKLLKCAIDSLREQAHPLP